MNSASETTHDARPPLLSTEQQDEFCTLLLRGASPAAAAAQSGLPLDSFRRTCRDDLHFRLRVEGVTGALAENVVAALYRAALEGSVTAQSCWLRYNRPPDWSAGEASQAGG